ncbi:hypothetical protein ACRAWD_29225 [Caulobacter segnis]
MQVLNHIRVIQGDGVNPVSIAAILERIVAEGFSAENLTFGMGGGLLQQLDRDTQKFALKCSAAKVDGRWIDVGKDPVTDPGKRSEAGRLMLLTDGAERLSHRGGAGGFARPNRAGARRHGHGPGRTALTAGRPDPGRRPRPPACVLNEGRTRRGRARGGFGARYFDTLTGTRVLNLRRLAGDDEPDDGLAEL